MFSIVLQFIHNNEKLFCTKIYAFVFNICEKLLKTTTKC